MLNGKEVFQMLLGLQNNKLGLHITIKSSARDTWLKKISAPFYEHRCYITSEGIFLKN
jgi:hypothetical protein